MSNNTFLSFSETLQGLMAGDFTRLMPLFEVSPGNTTSNIVEWYDAGKFTTEPDALAEAFTCACFNGSIPTIKILLAHGIDPNGGMRTGLNAFHWAANRGQLSAVELLISHQANLETVNIYGGTVLGCAVWSAVHETKHYHPQIVELLLQAGAHPGAAKYPSGLENIDIILRKYGVH